MPDLQNEPLAALVRELREERIAEKAEREAQAQRERWTRYTSITIVVVAVLTAVASLWVGKFSTKTLAALNDATFHQVKASDTWALYQAKSIKQNLYEVTRDQTQALGAADARTAAILATMNGKLVQYEQDRRAIRADAERLERQRDESRVAADRATAQGGRMQLVVALLQIAVALCSIALVAKVRRLWEAGVLLAAGATVYMALTFFP